MSIPTPESAPAENNDKMLILGCHLSIIVCLGLIFSLIIFLIKKEEPVARHAKETLNFNITFLICVVGLSIVATIASLILSILGLLVYLVILAAYLGAIVCGVLGAKAASEGGFYMYPVNFRLIK